MSQFDHNRVQRFTSDEITAEMVKGILLDSFMKKRDGDVYTKAAQMMAIDLLNDAWKELQQIQNRDVAPKKSRQVGL